MRQNRIPIYWWSLIGLSMACLVLSQLVFPMAAVSQQPNWESPPVSHTSDVTPVRDTQVETLGFNSSVSVRPSASIQFPSDDRHAIVLQQPPADEATAPFGLDSKEWISQASGQLGQVNWKKMLLSLCLVVGGYLVFVFVARWIGPRRAAVLPSEVIEVLGTLPFNTGRNLQLVRLGSKLLLLVHGPEGTHSIGEISNPNEVEHLAQICCQRRGRRGPTSFRKFPESASNDPSPAELDTLMRSLRQALQRFPAHAEYEA